MTGLASESLCPECGTPVRDSLQGRRLEASSPEYRRSVALGLTIGMVASLCMSIGGVFRLGAGTRIGGMRAPSALLTESIGPVFSLLLVGAMWLVTAPDPGLAQGDFANTSRGRARIATIVLMVAILLQLTIAVVNPAGLASALAPGIAGALSVGLAGLALLVVLTGSWVIWCVLICEYLAALAWRIPDRNLTIWCQRAGWLVPAIHVGGYLCCGIGPIAASLAFAGVLMALRFHTSGIFAAGTRKGSGEA